VHLVGFCYKNISRCTVLWMSNLSSTFNCKLDFQIPFLSFLFVVAMLTFLLLLIIIIILLIMYQAASCLYWLQNLFSILLFLSLTFLSRPPLIGFYNSMLFLFFYSQLTVPSLWIDVFTDACYQVSSRQAPLHVCLCLVTLAKHCTFYVFLKQPANNFQTDWSTECTNG